MKQKELHQCISDDDENLNNNSEDDDDENSDISGVSDKILNLQTNY